MIQKPKTKMIGLLLALLSIAIIAGLYGAPSFALQSDYVANLTGGSEVPPVKTNATGIAKLIVNNSNPVEYLVNVTDINNVTLSHIHLGEKGKNGPIVVALYRDSLPTGEMRGTLAEHTFIASDLQGPLAGKQISELVNDMNKGLTYIDVHTSDFPQGEIRGQILSSGNSTSLGAKP